jgi:protein-tyrosine-phosphatase
MKFWREMRCEQSGRETQNVLFLCSGNSARSLIAEVILNRIGPPRFEAHSAGSHPKGAVHPAALRLLKELGYDTSALRSKSWDEFTESPAFDHVITLCSKVAQEACPVVPGAAMRHWDIPDPSSASGPQMQATFRQTYDLLSEKIQAFVHQHCHDRGKHTQARRPGQR